MHYQRTATMISKTEQTKWQNRLDCSEIKDKAKVNPHAHPDHLPWISQLPIPVVGVPHAHSSPQNEENTCAERWAWLPEERQTNCVPSRQINHEYLKWKKTGANYQ